ncbi:ABC transporter permease [Lysinibacter cavernae]|uniref:Putative ABC transport system permease protein n=1 Tax=Lysinibacter cavernae TaxID=1640652 RepID=A0A7X5QZT1_9MICO|nr:ABC transporter permease [Lysinibacter cavernae]NIH52902.1 putative ABC transport system permease protein [Lysinibacter cavernae]
MMLAEAAKQPGQTVSVVVVVLSACYAVLLLGLTSVISQAILFSDFGGKESVIVVLQLLAISFLIISFVVSTVVITNTYSIITAGRVADIARRRLLGSSVRNERIQIARNGLLVGAIGVITGGALGLLLVRLIADGGVQSGILEPNDYVTVKPEFLLPLVGIWGCVWWAAWRGSRGVLAVNPIESLGAATSASEGAASSRGKRRLNGFSVTFLLLGLILLGIAVVSSTFTFLAIFPGLIGGVCTVVGFIGGASVIIPGFFALCERLLPRTFVGLLASRGLQRHPDRTARAALGVVVSIAVVTMFVVATSGFEPAMRLAYGGTEEESTAFPLIDMVVAVVLVVISFTAIISAIGLVNSVALNTRLRQREIGMFRVLGQSRRDVVAVIYAETARLAIGSAVLGLLMGILFGWIGLQCVVGGVRAIGVAPLVVPPLFILGVIVAAGVLTVSAALLPSRRACSIPAIHALAA